MIAWLAIGVLLLLTGSPSPAAVAEQPSGPVEVVLASKGEAQLPIAIPETASSEIERLAREAAVHLERVTGASFKIARGVDWEAPHGIIFAEEKDRPGFLPKRPDGVTARQTKDDYLLQTAPGAVLLIGRTAHGTENALWDFFYQIGFRQFFPGPHWEIWPRRPHLSVSLDRFETPSFYTRRLFIGGNTWGELKHDFSRWETRNRMKSGFTLNTGHAYGAIIRRHRQHFEKHPGDLVTGGDRDSTKLNASSPTVLEIVAKDVREQIRKKPDLDSISMDPSDGAGWADDSPLGSPSNQAFTLANHAARVLREVRPGSKIGIYAYFQHALPPDIEIDKDIIVSIATSFLRDGHTVESLIEQWRKKGVELGIREYLSVWSWSQDLPGSALATDLNYVARSISNFHAKGVRYWTSEMSNGWGSQGLGYYLASRVLWDVNEADRLDTLLDDFFHRSFGKAAREMRAFFTLILHEGHPLLSEDLVGRMYRALDRALQASDQADVVTRIHDFVIYTRFVELMLAHRNAPASERQQAYETLARFGYQTRRSAMFNSVALFRTLPERMRGTETVAPWNAPEDQHPLKSDKALSPGQIAAILKEGIANNQPAGFKVIEFPGELRPFPAEDDGPEDRKRGLTIRNKNRLHLYHAEKETPFRFSVKGGLIYGDRGNVKLRLFTRKHPIQHEAVAVAEVKPDRTPHEVELVSPYSGAHWLEIEDGGDATEITWPSGQHAAWPARPDEHLQFRQSYDAVFYVPPGTKVVGGYFNQRAGTVETLDGTVKLNFAQRKRPGYFTIPVEEGDGVWWRLRKVKGQQILLTVPPYLARTPSEILIPQTQ